MLCGCSRGTDAAGQLVLLGCWWFFAGGCGCRVPAGAIDALRLWAGALWVQQGNGCRPAVAIGVLRLWAGGYGCRVPAGAIGVLVALCWWLWVQGASWCYRCAEAVGWCSVGAAGERMQASGGYRGAEAVGWWLWVQGASWCYRGAGGSVLVAMGAACQRWLLTR